MEGGVTRRSAIVSAGICGLVLAVSAAPWRVLPIYGGGFVQGVEIAASNPRVWYSYVDVGGPYRSDDAGRHWLPLHQNLTLDQRRLGADKVRSLSIDPRDADSFVMVAGERFDSPGGAYVSRDGGKTFRRTLRTRFYGGAARRMTGVLLARDPSDPDRLVTGGDWDGLFLSEDNGETWRSVGATEEHWFTDIQWDKAVKGRVYASSNEYSPWRWGYAGFKGPVARKTGFLRSDDGGRTWRNVSTRCPAEFAQTGTGGTLVGIFERTNVLASVDGGQTWTDFHAGLPTENPKGDRLDPRSPCAFEAVSAGPDYFLVGSRRGDIYRRQAGETAWQLVQRTRMTLSEPAAESHLKGATERLTMDYLSRLTVDPRDPRHWIATDWYEIWETFDAGETWRSAVSGIMQLVSFTLAFDPNDANNMAYGSADMGLHCTTDGGRTWTIANHCVDTTSVSYSHRTPGFVLACGGKKCSALTRSMDSGRTWDWVSAPWRCNREIGLPKPDLDPCGYFTVAIDPLTDEAFLCVSGPCEPGKGGVYRSCDKGLTWAWCSKGLPRGQPLFKNEEFGPCWKPELVFGFDGSLLCVASKTGRSYRFERETLAWSPAMPLNPSNAGSLVADPFRPGRFLFSGGVLGESLDGGRTFAWKDWLRSGCGRHLAFDEHVKDLFVTLTDSAILVSRDGGAHYSVIDDGLRDLPTGGNRSFVFLDRGRLFFVTEGSGVWVKEI